MKTISARLPDEKEGALAEWCRREDVTVGALLEALTDLVDHDQLHASLDAMIDAAREITETRRRG